MRELIFNTYQTNHVKYYPAWKRRNIKDTKTKQIVALQRGWIVIGDVEKTESEVRISNCSVIRIWGTSKGLGEIAENDERLIKNEMP